MPILALSGHSAGPSELKLACASVHIVCPSAASGLTVRPSGRVTTAFFISDGDAAKPKNCGALNSIFRPDGASVSLCGRAGIQNRVEYLEFASRRFRIFGFFA